MSSDNFSPSVTATHMHSPPITQPSSTNPSPPSDTSMAAAAAVGTAQPVLHEGQLTQLDENRQDLPRPYKCPICDKAFHRLEHQTRHIRTHTGEKPHACQFPGCQKRFSRSDELTRHSRIHSNPNSRRGKAVNNVHQALAFPGTLPEGQMPYLMPAGPQAIQYPNTAPNSNMASPDVSPPHSYIAYHTPPQYPTPYSYSAQSHSGYDSPVYAQPHSQPDRGINLLATAASQVEIERERQSASAPTSAFQPHRRPPHHHTAHHHPYSHASPASGSARIPSIAQYAFSSQSMSRSASQDGYLDDPYAHAVQKRSRPPSPQYTNPHSPIHSGGSSGYSPTPGHTPAITPGHSPRLQAEAVQLPGIRSLNIGHATQQHPHPIPGSRLGAPETLEPTADINHNTSFTNNVNSSYGTSMPGSTSHSRRASLTGSPKDERLFPYSRSLNNSGMRIGDIVNRGEARTLPAPKQIPSGTATPARGSMGESGGREKGVNWMLNDGENKMDES